MLKIVFRQVGGRPVSPLGTDETLTIQLRTHVMESELLAWGRLCCSDDPVVDYATFEDRMVPLVKDL